jgi:hypothetical protein
MTMKQTKTPRSIVALAFPKRVAALISLAKAIAEGLTGNASFPNPDPSVASINKAIADLEAAETAAKTRLAGAVDTRDQKRADLIALLQGAKAFVQKVADASPEQAPALIKSAAMGVRKASTHGKHVFAVKQGSLSGSVSIEAAVPGPRASYEWEYSSDGGKTWLPMPPTSRSKTELTGLQPGTSYSFRCRSVTKAGPSDWSQPLAMVVK